MEELEVITAPEVQGSPARARAPRRTPFRVAAVQHRWHAGPR